MQRVDKPWGHEIIWANSEKITGKVLHIKKGHRLSLQYHEKKEEAVYVMSGNLKLTIKDKDGNLVEKTLSVGSAHHVYPGDVHRFEAVDEDVTLVEVSTSELCDVVRIEDDYKRVDS